MITGQEVTNITMDGINATTIQYENNQQLADIMNLGPGTIYVSWRRAATMGDVNCLRLPAGSSYEIRPKSGWNTLSVISDQASTIVQVVSK